jgi:dTMP kinase
MDILSNFLVFEGGDGSGTSTQLSILAESLKKAGKPAFFSTFEPTDGQIGKLIRGALKKELSITPKTLAYLFAADRNEHIYGENGILRQLESGKLVISDRYTPSSLVYQGLECGDDLPKELNSRFPAPETLIFLDVDVEIALSRMKNRASHEIYEYREFQLKVREKYKSLLGMYESSGVKIHILDAAKSAEEVAAEVWSIVSQMPIFNT